MSSQQCHHWQINVNVFYLQALTWARAELSSTVALVSSIQIQHILPLNPAVYFARQISLRAFTRYRYTEDINKVLHIITFMGKTTHYNKYSETPGLNNNKSLIISSIRYSAETGNQCESSRWYPVLTSLPLRHVRWDWEFSTQPFVRDL